MILKCEGYRTAKRKVCPTDRIEARDRIGELRDRLRHAGVQFRKAVHRDRGQDAFAIAEMMVRGLMADAGAPRDFAHAQRREPRFLNEVEARVENDATKIG